MKTRLASSIVLLLIGAAVGCDEGEEQPPDPVNVRECVYGADQPCPCAAGMSGVQHCVYDETGATRWDSCECPEPFCAGQFVSRTDDDFADDDWTWELVPERNVGDNNSFSATQSPQGGNLGAYRKMTLTIGEGQVTLWVLNIKTSATWNPATDGAICGIRAALDGTDKDAGTAATFYSLAMKQGTRIFWSDRFEVNVEGWARESVDESAFKQFSPLSGPGSLDFSTGGEAIHFGFLVGASGNNTTGAPRVFTYGVDNWRFEICPCTN